VEEGSEVVAAVVEGEDVVGAFFHDYWFRGRDCYGICGGVRRREGMVVVVVAVAVGGEVGDVEGREWVG